LTGNPQYDALAQRIGQKTRDAASNATIWCIIGRSGGAAASTADPIDAGRQLSADYVVTGNVEAAGDALRVTFQVDDVHSGARVWSRTVSPTLESLSTTAEAEVAGHAEVLLSEAILEAERGAFRPPATSRRRQRRGPTAACAISLTSCPDSEERTGIRFEKGACVGRSHRACARANDP
jgi:hypothetical protein